MRHFASTITLLSIFSLVTANYFSPWALLPKQRDWQKLAKSLTPEDVQPYVSVYIAPIHELQKAQRDMNMTGHSIKASVLAALDGMQAACNRLNITEAIYQKRQKEDFKESLDDMVTAFDSTSTRSLEPVFKSATISNFMFQIANDLMISAKDYRDLMNRRNSLCGYLKSAMLYITDVKPDSFKYIVTRNLDLVEVRNYSARVIEEYMTKGTSKKSTKKLSYRLHTLGNSSNQIMSSSKYLLGSVALILLAQAIFF